MSKFILPRRMRLGDTIGIVQPSHVADPISHARTVSVLNRMGFKVKTGENIFKDTFINVASATERASDINSMAADDNISMVFFGGGDSAVSVLPYIDYDLIRKHPKIYVSYSDGTVILNAIHAKTGLVTYYGITPGEFVDLRQYNWKQFESHFIEGHSADIFENDTPINVIHDGKCTGQLLGGYSLLFALMMTSPYFSYDTTAKYLLFIEDYAGFSPPSSYTSYLTFIEQSAIMRQVVGIMIGHFSDNPPDILLKHLRRLGEDHDIPVIYSDDFGHGTRHAILPMGVTATLDTATLSIKYDYSSCINA